MLGDFPSATGTNAGGKGLRELGPGWLAGRAYALDFPTHKEKSDCTCE